jgi:hypothetical protein
MAAHRLSADPGRRKAGNQVMPCSGGQSRQLLSVPQAGQREGRRDGIARRNPETSGANAGLWGSHHSEAHNHRDRVGFGKVVGRLIHMAAEAMPSVKAITAIIALNQNSFHEVFRP